MSTDRNTLLTGDRPARGALTALKVSVDSVRGALPVLFSVVWDIEVGTVLPRLASVPTSGIQAIL